MATVGWKRLMLVVVVTVLIAHYVAISDCRHVGLLQSQGLSSIASTQEEFPTLSTDATILTSVGNNAASALSSAQLAENPVLPKIDSGGALHNIDSEPDSYKVSVVFDISPHSLDASTLDCLRQAVAKQLDRPLNDIVVGRIWPESHSVELYVLYNVTNDVGEHQGDHSVSVLVPVLQAVQRVSQTQLQANMAPARVTSITAESNKDGKVQMPKEELTVWKVLRDQGWSSWELPMIMVCCFLVVFAIAVIMVFLCYRRDPSQKLPLVEEPRQVVYQPVMRPSVADADTVQPEIHDSYLLENDSEQTPSPRRSPLRMKAKGLLERRGSNASLTLDLNRSQENLPCAMPPKESTAEEFLLSAGNRMTRKQLRNCLKDIKTIHAEFWQIPMNHPEKLEIPGCGTKNRYKTILPNEHSRVWLPDVGNDPLSTYINANYIHGYDGEPKAYIAAQGPMTHTVDDFWRMAWHERTPIVVMITKLQEKNKVKCEPYIPDRRGVYGGIEVSVVKVVPRDGYTIRELYLKRGDDVHQILHFWYTSWPDHKAPSTAKQLLAMALEVEALRHDNNGVVKGPTVIHCSAGIGRTGCFIATSIGIQQLLEENMVDILGITCALRLDRGGMVQTAEQYEFVHQTLFLFERTLPDQSGE